MSFLKGKSKRTVIFSVITLSSLIILLALNFLMSYFGQKKVMYMDMSKEGLYSITDKMVEECKFIDELGKTDGDKKVKITFCTDPDYLSSAYVTRPTYYMALQMENEYSNIAVETVNVENNPTALSKYKTTSLTEITPSDVIVSYGDRYRIVKAESFWLTDASSEQYFSYNGEYRIATLIKSVTAIGQPAAYFVTDHGETYYDPENPTSDMSISMAYCYDLLRDCGLEVKTLKISEVDEIPDDCALLIINNPRSDFSTDPDRYNELYYMSDLDKLDKYLINNQGAIMVNKDYDENLKLPVLEDFLHEWGFDFGTAIIRDPESSVSGSSDTGIITVYETETDSYANAIYGDYASLGTSPQTIVNNTGYIIPAYGEEGVKNEAGSMFTVKRYATFLKTAATASAYLYNSAADDGYADSSILDLTAENYIAKYGQLDLAALSVREAFDNFSAEYFHSYLFCSASPDFLSNEALSNPSYANYDVISALVKNISRTDVYADIDLGGDTWNSASPGGKELLSTELTEEDVEVLSPTGDEVVKVNYAITTGAKVVYTVIVALVPFTFLVIGIIVCVRRRFL
ncbi:MAG: Gldg family protein [Clostridia bacterium]|nr:Gldg family protein [Clostridia bacterium]